MLIHLKQVYGFPKHGYSMDDRVPMGELVVVLSRGARLGRKTTFARLL
jgi:hypothetical protein